MEYGGKNTGYKFAFPPYTIRHTPYAVALALASANCIILRIRYE